METHRSVTHQGTRRFLGTGVAGHDGVAVENIKNKLSGFLQRHASAFVATHEKTNLNKVVFRLTDLNITESLFLNLKREFPGAEIQSDRLYIPIKVGILSRFDFINTIDHLLVAMFIAASLLMLKVVV